MVLQLLELKICLYSFPRLIKHFELGTTVIAERPWENDGNFER